MSVESAVSRDRVLWDVYMRLQNAPWSPAQYWSVRAALRVWQRHHDASSRAYGYVFRRAVGYAA